MEIQPIARFHSPLTSKFGLPRQSADSHLRGEIELLAPVRNPDALRGIEGFSHLWLIWEFSEVADGQTRLMVRPPRLGGNKKMGVLATRSPFRPNRLGLSVVRLDHVEWTTPRGPILHVLGADLMDGTPIYDIKPYVAFADSHPDALGGFVDANAWKRLEVVIPADMEALLAGRCQLTPTDIEALREVLAEDPRPQYHDDGQRVYGMPFAGWDVKFKVSGTTLTVCGVEECRG